MKTLGKVLKWASLVLLSLVIIWIALGCYLIYYVVPQTDIKGIAKEILNENINADVDFSGMDITFFSSIPDLSLSINDLCIKDSITSDTIISLESADISFNVMGLLEKRLSLKEIELKRPFTDFKVDTSGQNNLANLIKLKPEETQKEDSVFSMPEIFNINNMEIIDGRFRYSNATTGNDFDIQQIGLKFKGRINTKDTTLDIRQGVFAIGTNSLDFKGFMTTDTVDAEIKYSLPDIDGITDFIAIQFKNNITTALSKSNIKGNFEGECNISGDINSSLQGLTFKGYSNAEGLAFISPNNKRILNEGNFSFKYQYVVGIPECCYVELSGLQLKGDYLLCKADGCLKYNKHGYWIDGKLLTEGSLTGVTSKTGLLPQGDILTGDIDLNLSTSSSIKDLSSKYKFPKTISDLKATTKHIELPNIKGALKLRNLNLKNDTVDIVAGTLNIDIDGKLCKGQVYIDDINIAHRENTKLNIKKADISLNGNQVAAEINIDKLDYSKDSLTISADKINMGVGSTESEFAIGYVDALKYQKGDNQIFGARISTVLTKETNKEDRLWDRCQAGILILQYNSEKVNAFGRIMTASFNLKDSLSDLSVHADSLKVQVSGNTFSLNDVAVNTGEFKQFKLSTGRVESRELTMGVELDIASLNLDFDSKIKQLALNTGRIHFGESDIAATGKVYLAEKNPKIDVSVTGNYLNINQVMMASNRSAFVMGDPYAINPDSIPAGAIPRSIGKDETDLSLNLKLNRLTLSSLNLQKTEGQIFIKGKSTLIKNLKSECGLNLNTRFTYFDPDHSATDVNLQFDKLDMTRLAEIIPDIGNASPMLSALHGTIDLQLVMHSPVKHLIVMEISNSKVAAALQARNLSIKDNEDFREIAKTLMFKNKESTSIDSMAVAAKIDEGKVTILPFMLKIDRYKLAIGGGNDINTKYIDYHISVLKSPIPFKFGLNIVGEGPKYKTKIVKTEYKKLDPSIKPWTDPEFVEYMNKLKEPIEEMASKL